MAIYRKFRKYSGKNRRGYGRKKSPVTKAIRKVRNASFKKKVLSVIRSQAETKSAYLEVGWSDFNSAISNPGDAMRILPYISQGTGDNARIGDQIRCTKIKLSGILQMIPQTNTNTYDNRKIAVRMMIVTPKSFPNWDQAGFNTATWMPYLLKKGGTTSAFNGTVHDIYAPVNTDAITCHYNKVIYLNQSAIFQSTASGVASVDQSNLVRFWRHTLKIKNKLLKYDANVNSGLTPSNYGPVLVLGYALVDPSAAPDTLTTRVRFHFSSAMDFEDC